jgi:penicillin-insensitive murein endopeptidase
MRLDRTCSIAAAVAIAATAAASPSFNHAVAQSAAPSAGKAVAPVAPAAAHNAKATDTKTPDTKAPESKASDAKAAATKPAPIPAKQLFGAVATPAPLAARSIGSYAKGCLAGAQALPITGDAWQVMRLKRNRNWGHPVLIAFLERFAREAKRNEGWTGLLVGDIAQPRGGPMSSGHASHQVGLDADIWFTPMPPKTLSNEEREEISATSMLVADKLSVDDKAWDDRRARLIKRAASEPEVERIFVHPAIKKKLCETADKLGGNRAWLAKVRPWWDHYYHFHVRIACPAGSPGCVKQEPVHGDDGCGKELDDWFARLTAPPKPPPPGPKKPPPPPMTIDALPADCRVVLNAGTATASDPKQQRTVKAN